MLIKDDQKIAGLPAREVRDLLRPWRQRTCGISRLASHLQRGDPSPAEFVAKFVAAGLLCEADRAWPAQETSYVLTEEGIRLANASLWPGISRRTGTRILHELFDRCDEINRDPYWFLGVPSVYLFGSMLGDAERVGDIDLVPRVEMKPQFEDERGLHFALRSTRALAEGRGFDRSWDYFSWAQEEVRLFLRKGSRYLSFHAGDLLVERQVELSLVYDAPRGRLMPDPRQNPAPVAPKHDPFASSGVLTYIGDEYSAGRGLSEIMLPDGSSSVRGDKDDPELVRMAEQALAQHLKRQLKQGIPPEFPFPSRQLKNEFARSVKLEIHPPLADRVRAARAQHRQGELERVEREWRQAQKPSP